MMTKKTRTTMSSVTNETTNPIGRMTMSGGAFVTPDVVGTVRAGTGPTGRMAMTTGPKTAEEIAALATSDRAALSTNEVVVGTGADKATRSDRAAWAAGEWAIVGARRPAKRAAPRAHHERPVPMKQAAWAAGEWAMPDADSNEELD
jgi:hypothetical protein